MLIMLRKGLTLQQGTFTAVIAPETVILSALNDIAKAKGMSGVAEKSGLGRESMYKALRPGAKPRFETIMKILHALGFSLSVTVPGAEGVSEDEKNTRKYGHIIIRSGYMHPDRTKDDPPTGYKFWTGE